MHAPSQDLSLFLRSTYLLAVVMKIEKLILYTCPTIRLLYYYLFFISIFGSVCVRLTEGTVYHVKPVKHLTSCPGNSSCRRGQLCHTMDYLAEHSSEFFSPDHVNVTLIFMCGVHNFTKDLIVQNLHSFVMKGAAESREECHH